MDIIEFGFIIPSQSPHGAPILFQVKKDTPELRLCMDYRELNKKAIKNKYLLPLFAYCFEKLAKITSFCILKNDVFRPFLDKFVVVYLYDIVVFSKSMKDHEKHLARVFETSRQNYLT